jgi:hypothetical protein
MGTSTTSLPDTLLERVDRLIRSSPGPHEWGSSHLLSTPTSVVVRDLAARAEALEHAMREIALEVQRLSDAG